MNSRGFLLAAIFSSSLSARAATVTESFDTRADFDSGTAVWNQALGKVHPTLQVTQYESPVPPPPLYFSVGDGSDGVFDSTTYANFSVGGNISSQTIRIDTDAHPVLQFTSFTLAAGWKIVPVGTHPLIIKSLSTVKVLGEIHCEGMDGDASSGATPGAGGLGRCGGMNGGNGAAVGGSGQDGGDADFPSVTGGRGGSFSGGAVGGGGGGSWYTAISNPTNGPGSTAANGHAGASHSDPEFITIAGGSGGGGGSDDGANAGGGGGGGGGIVFIHAVGDIEIGASGYIFAGGGKGGDASGNAGPGGGGGAGGTQLYSGGSINNNNPDVQGSTKALSGGAGTNGSAVTGATGGAGRNWAAYNQSYNGFSVNPVEDSPLVSGSFVEYNTAANQYVVSKVLDTGRKFRSVDSVTFSPASTHFLFEVAGSDDGFALDDTGFVTDLTLLANKRFLKMRLTIQGGNPLAPDMIDTATIGYTPTPPVVQDDYAFQSAGCGRIDRGSPGNSLWLLLAPLMLLVLRFKIRSRARRAH